MQESDVVITGTTVRGMTEKLRKHSSRERETGLALQQTATRYGDGLSLNCLIELSITAILNGSCGARLEDEIPKRAHLWQPKWDLFLSLRACAKPAKEPSERVRVRQLKKQLSLEKRKSPTVYFDFHMRSTRPDPQCPAGPQNGSACVEEEREPT
ncbi:hypothetical protein Bbelb_446530, partial [Branchiostoma belcheri]